MFAPHQIFSFCCQILGIIFIQKMCVFFKFDLQKIVQFLAGLDSFLFSLRSLLAALLAIFAEKDLEEKNQLQRQNRSRQSENIIIFS